MPQGKLKVKTKVPNNIKKAKKQTKGPAISKRANRPIKCKKTKSQEIAKMKQTITKTVNKSIETEMRAMIGEKQKLSKAQEAVARYNTTGTTAS